MTRLRLAAVAALVLAATTLASAAGAAGKDELKLNPVKSTFPVRSYVLTLPRGFELTGRKVQVLENGEPVTDVAVAPTSTVKAGSVLLIDSSKSMLGKPIEAAMEAARAFASYRKPGQKLAVITYDAEARVLLPLTTDPSRIQAALATTPSVSFFTKTYDAIAQAATIVRGAGLDAASIVLISDGRELGSSTTQVAAIAAARREGIRIFTVGLGTRGVDSEALRLLSGRTGGAFIEAHSPDALVGIYNQLGYRLANEYLLQYKSFAGPEEHVRVRVTVPGVEDAAGASYIAPPLSTPPPAAFVTSSVDRGVRSILTMLFVAAIAAGLTGIAASTLIRPQRPVIRQRLGAFVSLARPAEAKRQTALLSERLLAGTEQSLTRTRWWAWFKQELEIAEIGLAAEQIVVLTVGATLLMGWLFSLVWGTVAAIFAFALPLIVRALVKYRAERQRRLFAEQLPDNLQVLGSALRAGHSLVGALSVMVEDAPEPSRREFRRVVADEQLGVPLEDSFRQVSERMKSRDLEQVGLVAALQRQTGGNSAEVLDRVAETIRERAALRRLVRTLTAQGRMARWILTAIPVALFLFISVLNRDYMDPLFAETWGRLMLLAAGLMVVAGSLVIRKIIDIKV
jgi:tight adherence protein B